MVVWIEKSSPVPTPALRLVEGEEGKDSVIASRPHQGWKNHKPARTSASPLGPFRAGQERIRNSDYRSSGGHRGPSLCARYHRQGSRRLGRARTVSSAPAAPAPF